LTRIAMAEAEYNTKQTTFLWVWLCLSNEFGLLFVWRYFSTGSYDIADFYHYGLASEFYTHFTYFFLISQLWNCLNLFFFILLNLRVNVTVVLQYGVMLILLFIGFCGGLFKLQNLLLICPTLNFNT
jgi:hypothetical protein